MNIKKYFRHNKFNAVSSKCALGHYHRSKLEAAECGRLQLLLKSKNIKEVQFEKRFALVVNGVTVGHHKPDFFITHNDNSKEVRETKGVITADFSLRRNLFVALYPEIKYTLVR